MYEENNKRHYYILCHSTQHKDRLMSHFVREPQLHSKIILPFYFYSIERFSSTWKKFILTNEKYLGYVCWGVIRETSRFFFINI